MRISRSIRSASRQRGISFIGLLFVAVVLGALLLHEHVPVSAGRVPVYVLCVAAVAYGTVVLARPDPAADEG